ncbi:PRC-barrel domain-containing protein [Tropicimonas sp. IMCC34011]|uniref:PRC-barrel domain-containing protein n=1 Tax=Tropicimonas sp. IMCC34011 TaxID=2248759 RepID=UPI000E26CAE2|nr:PRC-barrel domain-containing protein [Tropicimonas sp. IMCC34011]
MLSGPDTDLISSQDVNGTRVFGAGGDHVGDIDHLLIDKKSGRIAYAVMSFGGFLGIGEDFHPIPWSALTYDPERGGFASGITAEQLQSAPDRHENWHQDRSWEEAYFAHYGAPMYWI